MTPPRVGVARRARRSPASSSSRNTASCSPRRLVRPPRSGLATEWRRPVVGPRRARGSVQADFEYRTSPAPPSGAPYRSPCSSHSDAMIPEARCRAGRLCLEGSESRNRLSGEAPTCRFSSYGPRAVARSCLLYWFHIVLLNALDADLEVLCSPLKPDGGGFWACRFPPSQLLLHATHRQPHAQSDLVSRHSSWAPQSLPASADSQSWTTMARSLRSWRSGMLMVQLRVSLRE